MKRGAPAGQQSGPDPDRRDQLFFSFDDLDGNAWLVREVKREAAS